MNSYDFSRTRCFSKKLEHVMDLVFGLESNVYIEMNIYERKHGLLFSYGIYLIFMAFIHSGNRCSIQSQYHFIVTAYTPTVTIGVE